jgi:hypothetical protein
MVPDRNAKLFLDAVQADIMSVHRLVESSPKDSDTFTLALVVEALYNAVIAMNSPTPS